MTRAGVSWAGTWFLLVGLVVLAASCGDEAGLAPEVEDPVDLLLAPPTQAEMDATLALLTARRVDAPADGLTVVDTRSEAFAALSLVSYRSTDGLRIYGVIATPKTPGSYPILLYNHGGDGGVSPSELNHPLAGGFIQAASSFRSEAVRWFGTDYVSDGPASPWDLDVDDTLILFACARQMPQADPDRAAVLGGSRGGGVSLLAAARRPEWFGAVIDIYGPTDLFDPVWRSVADSLAAGGTTPGPGWTSSETMSCCPTSPGRWTWPPPGRS